jgi:hypothetical protein
MFKMVLVLASIVVPIVLGFAITSFFWPRLKPFRFSLLLLRLSLAIGIGFGQASCLFFICLMVFGSSGREFVAAECTLLIAMFGILISIARGTRRRCSLGPGSDFTAESRLRWVLLATFLAVFAFAFAKLVLLTLNNPHGDWDAWAIWNMRARFLFEAGEYWRDAFSNLLDRSNPDYPLLIPTAIAGCWTYVGYETLFSPALIAGLFAVGTTGLLVGALLLLRGQSQAFLAGIILTSTPFFIRHAASQYADVPLGYFFLATFVLLALHDGLSKSDDNFLILAGVTAGLSAWTKNEGLLFLGAIASARLLAVAPAEGLRCYFRQMLSFAKGLIPVGLVILYFKVALAPSSYLTARQGSGTIVEKFFDPSRHFQVWKTLVSRVIEFGNWSISVPLILALYLLLLGGKVSEKEKPGVIAAGVTLSLLLLGYSVIFVITPLDLAFHLSTSVDRLLLQLWPSFIFFFFTIVCPIEKIVGSRTSAFRGDHAG